MNAELLRRGAVVLFVALFFLYLFGPLVIMGATAFNSASFPRIQPWDCFTVEWFEVLVNDTRLMQGLRNSLVIGFGVIAISVPIGLGGALLLTQVHPRLRPWYYTVAISPILIPGVVLGISTLVFWDRLGTMFNAGYHSVFYDGIFLTIVGQSTFVSAYCMLIFIARLQRFDPALEEAALDLGATHVQAFRRILLPFLKPAIGSAAVLAFLASFENYNTTVFTIVSESTLTTVLAGQVRYGINPSISALAVVIVAVTLLAAAILEVVRRRQLAAERSAARVAAGHPPDRAARARLVADPAFLLILAVFTAGLGTAFFAGTYGVEECKERVAEQRRQAIEERVRQRRIQELERRGLPVEGPAATSLPAPATRAPTAPGDFHDLFRPEALRGEPRPEPEADPEDPAQPPPAAPPEDGSLPGLFTPHTLQGDPAPDP